MTGRKEYEIKTIYCAVVAVFAFFLAVPVLRLLAESFASEAGAGIANYISVLTGKGFLTALGHSAAVSIASAVTATAIAFFLAYTIQYTNVPPVFKSLIRTLATLPMLRRLHTALPLSIPSENRGFSPDCLGARYLKFTALEDCCSDM